MKVLLAPPTPRIARRLRASGHVVQLVPAARLAAVREEDAQVFVVADLAGRRAAVRGVLEALRARAPRTPRVLVAEHLTTRMATAAGETGAFVTTVGAVPATLATIEAQLLRETGRASPKSKLQIDTLVPELHASGGPLDATKVAAALGVALSALAKAVGVTPSALSRRPTARTAQKGLREVEFVWSVLLRELGSDQKARAWLHASHPDLGGEPPLALLTTGSATDLAGYIRSALSGQPT